MHALGAQHLARLVGADHVHAVHASGDVQRGAPQQRPDAPLQPAHPGLARVLGDDHLERWVGDVHVARRHARGLQLAGDQVLPRDVDLVIVGVARQRDDLHAVQQRPRDGVEHVGGADEQHLRQVEREVEVVVAERAVLRRVQHLEHGRRGVAAHVRAHLVDLVDHDDRVHGAGVPDGPHDGAGHRADVGAPVPADLGLVAHAAHADARELTPQRAGDAAPQRGLAHAGGPREQDDRARRAALEACHRQLLEDALLHARDAVVVLVQHALRAVQVQVVLGVGAPGDVQDPVEVRADDLVLGRLVGDAPQARELAVGRGAHLVRQRGLLDSPPELVDLGLVALAQLVLDGLELLAQHEFPLALLDVLLHLGLDARAKLQHLRLARQDLAQAPQARRHTHLLQQLLLLGHGQAQRRGDQVRQRAGVVHVGRGHLQLIGQVGHQVHHPGERGLHVARQGLELVRLLHDVGHGLHGRNQEGVRPRVAGEPHPLAAVHQNAHGAVGHPQHLLHGGHHAHAEQVVRPGLAHVLVARGHQHQAAHLAVHHVVHEADAALLADGQGRHRVGEHHGALEGEHGEVGGPGDLRCHGGLLRGGHHHVLRHGVAVHLHGHHRAPLVVAHRSPRTVTRTASGPLRGASGSVITSMPRS